MTVRKDVPNLHNSGGKLHDAVLEGVLQSEGCDGFVKTGVDKPRYIFAELADVESGAAAFATLLAQGKDRYIWKICALG